jgi:hypothetical protein
MRKEDLFIDIIFDPLSFRWTVPLSWMLPERFPQCAQPSGRQERKDQAILGSDMASGAASRRSVCCYNGSVTSTSNAS